jgi:hypothetical protein
LNQFLNVFHSNFSANIFVDTYNLTEDYKYYCSFIAIECIFHKFYEFQNKIINIDENISQIIYYTLKAWKILTATWTIFRSKNRISAIVIIIESLNGLIIMAVVDDCNVMIWCWYLHGKRLYTKNIEANEKKTLWKLIESMFENEYFVVKEIYYHLDENHITNTKRKLIDSINNRECKNKESETQKELKILDSWRWHDS